MVGSVGTSNQAPQHGSNTLDAVRSSASRDISSTLAQSTSSNPSHPAPSAQSPAPSPASESGARQTSSSRRRAAPRQLFIPNKVEKAWLIDQLRALGAPVQKLQTLEKTFESVSRNARMRKATDQEFAHDMGKYGMAWRNDYMAAITKANVLYVNNTLIYLAEKVAIDETVEEEDGIGPVAAAREGFRKDRPEQLLDQAALDYKYVADKKISTTDQDAVRALAKRKESRKEKNERIAKRKAEFAKAREEKEMVKKARLQARKLIDIQNAKSLAASANAMSVSAKAVVRSSAQFDAFLSLYAAKNQLDKPDSEIPLPDTSNIDGVVLDLTGANEDNAANAVSQNTNAATANSNNNNTSRVSTVPQIGGGDQRAEGRPAQAPSGARVLGSDED